MPIEGCSSNNTTLAWQIRIFALTGLASNMNSSTRPREPHALNLLLRRPLLLAFYCIPASLQMGGEDLSGTRHVMRLTKG